MDERSERMARRFELPILAAALLVIPVIVLEQADVGEPFDSIASVFNWLIWLAFLAEAVAMLSVVPGRFDGDQREIPSRHLAPTGRTGGRRSQYLARNSLRLPRPHTALANMSLDPDPGG
jgi:hypothetical protein